MEKDKTEQIGKKELRAMIREAVENKMNEWYEPESAGDAYVSARDERRKTEEMLSDFTYQVGFVVDAYKRGNATVYNQYLDIVKKQINALPTMKQ